MRRVVCVLVASFLSLHSQELDEDAIALDNELVEEPSLLVAGEFGNFTGEAAEFSSGPLVEEKDPLLSAREPKKNGLYFLLPIGSLNPYFLPGLDFRHHLDNGFLEVSYFNAKQADIVLNRYKGLFEVESTEKLGVVYENMLNASYGFQWNTRYISPYLSLGGGLYLPYVRYEGTSSVDFLPAVSTALGVEFRYGFVDLALNYLPIKWKGKFEHQEEGQDYTFDQQMRLLANFRLGLGFPF